MYIGEADTAQATHCEPTKIGPFGSADHDQEMPFQPAFRQETMVFASWLLALPHYARSLKLYLVSGCDTSPKEDPYVVEHHCQQR